MDGPPSKPMPRQYPCQCNTGKYGRCLKLKIQLHPVTFRFDSVRAPVTSSSSCEMNGGKSYSLDFTQTLRSGLVFRVTKLVKVKSVSRCEGAI
jgi:hypothetical protein